MPNIEFPLADGFFYRSPEHGIVFSNERLAFRPAWPRCRESGGKSGEWEPAMYRSVTESRMPREGRRRALYRVEGILIGVAIFLGVFYALDWWSL